MAFTAEGSRRGRTLLPPRPKDGQNRATTLGIWGMSADSSHRFADVRLPTATTVSAGGHATRAVGLARPKRPVPGGNGDHPRTRALGEFVGAAKALANPAKDATLGLTDTGPETLADARTGKNGRHRLAGLLRQSVFGRLAGHEEVNDAERLCRDPAMRWVVGERTITGSAASVSQIGRFETKSVSRSENLAALADLPSQWVDKVHRRRPPKTIVLDTDSSVSPTYGEQEGSVYNGHFGCTCYRPLFMFKQLGDVERWVLRCGNVHSADCWRAVREPVVARYRGIVKRLYFRGDAAFANPKHVRVS
jgi:hypothetical protein